MGHAECLEVHGEREFDCAWIAEVGGVEMIIWHAKLLVFRVHHLAPKVMRCAGEGVRPQGNFAHVLYALRNKKGTTQPMIVESGSHRQGGVAGPTAETRRDIMVFVHVQTGYISS